MSFGTLVLYGNDFYTLGIMVLIITATVFAADRKDLKDMGANKMFVIFIIAVAIMTIFASLTVADALGGYLFYTLTTICFVMLISYAALARSIRARRNYDLA